MRVVDGRTSLMVCSHYCVDSKACAVRFEQSDSFQVVLCFLGSFDCVVKGREFCRLQAVQDLITESLHEESYQVDLMLLPKFLIFGELGLIGGIVNDNILAFLADNDFRSWRYRQQRSGYDQESIMESQHVFVRALCYSNKSVDSLSLLHTVSLREFGDERRVVHAKVLFLVSTKMFQRIFVQGVEEQRSQLVVLVRCV